MAEQELEDEMHNLVGVSRWEWADGGGEIGVSRWGCLDGGG